MHTHTQRSRTHRLFMRNAYGVMLVECVWAWRSGSVTFASVYTISHAHTHSRAHSHSYTHCRAHFPGNSSFLFASFSPALSISLNLSPFFPLLLSLMHYHLAFFPIPNVPTRKRDIPQKIVRHRMINRILRSSLSISLSIHCAYAVPIQTCQYCLLNCCYVTSLCWWSLPSFF